MEKVEEQSKKINLDKKLFEVSKESRRLWIDVLTKNRNSVKGMTNEYVAPKFVNGEVEIEIEEDDIEFEVKFWESSLIIYVLG